MAGPAQAIGTAMTELQSVGPMRGYYPEPSKSLLICNEKDKATLQTTLERFQFQYCNGARYLGGFIGSITA